MWFLWGFEFDGDRIVVGGSGSSVLEPRVSERQAGLSQVALVIDDLVSLDPFIARRSRARPPPPSQPKSLAQKGFYLIRHAGHIMAHSSG
jgi:pyridoxamine 5'-phosphate oxidase family protein